MFLGKDFLDPDTTFTWRRIPPGGAVPPYDPKLIDVVILDMNHGWPNLGHDSIIQAIHEAAVAMRGRLEEAGLRIRALSFDVRRELTFPLAGERFHLFIGTGGPGHLDPRINDGIIEGSQGISENPAWEDPLFQLFDAVLADQRKAMLAICHTFGLVCRWRGIAEPRLREESKGGKSAGIVENVLTDEARAHPWFSRFAEARGPENLKVLDNRLYDLIPTAGAFPDRALPIGYEAVGGERGEAVTMVELARDVGGIMPRFLAVNHHPEIGDQQRLLAVLDEKLERGEVDRKWYEERAKVFRQELRGEGVEHAVRLTARYSFLGPLEFHLNRLLHLRVEHLAAERPVEALLAQ
jgi:hypothetical protein